MIIPNVNPNIVGFFVRGENGTEFEMPIIAWRFDEDDKELNPIFPDYDTAEYTDEAWVYHERGTDLYWTFINRCYSDREEAVETLRGVIERRLAAEEKRRQKNSKA